MKAVSALKTRRAADSLDVLLAEALLAIFAEAVEVQGLRRGQVDDPQPLSGLHQGPCYSPRERA